MKKSFKFLYLFLLGILFLPFSVSAEGQTLTYHTTITNWKPNNNLYINATSSLPENVTSSWELICTSGGEDTDIALNFASGKVFENIDNECDSAEFIETIDFSNMTLTANNLGLNEMDSIQPSTFDPDQSFIPFVDGITYSFGSYQPTSYPISYYVLNTVDQNGNITDGPYVRDIFFTNGEDEKTANQDIGSITVPNYAVRFTLQVKGNIANPNGSFTIDYADSSKDDVTYNYDLGEENIVSLPLSMSEFNGLYSNPSSLLSVSYDAEDGNTYLMEGLEGAVDPDTIGSHITIGGNTFYLDYTVSATLNADGSDTGLFYNIWPFIIVLLFGGAFIGLFFFQKKKRKSVVIVDKEVL